MFFQLSVYHHLAWRINKLKPNSKEINDDPNINKQEDLSILKPRFLKHDEGGLKRNIIGFISADAKVIYCFPVSVSDYILCIAWVSLTFRASINLHLSRDEFVLKKRGVYIPKQCLMIYWLL